MMRKYIAALWVAATALCSCEKNADQNIYTLVTLQAHMPDGENIVSMTADQSLRGTFLRNMNTLQDFDYPVFVNGTCTVRLLKGAYMMAFDADAAFRDGSVKRVRFSGYNSPERAVNLLNDTETVDLDLTVLP